MKKNYVIAEYGQGVAMYENNDFRLKDKEVIKGTYKTDKTVKGLFNGYEKGIFTADNGKKYIIFVDHSAKEIVNNSNIKECLT